VLAVTKLSPMALYRPPRILDNILMSEMDMKRSHEKGHNVGLICFTSTIGDRAILWTSHSKGNILSDDLHARIFRDILGWYSFGGLVDLATTSSAFTSAVPLISPCERFIVQLHARLAA